jgi:glycine/D-amino acid oxidase-like deaminating enzyme
MAALFTDDFKTTPYWWERTPRPEIAMAALPGYVDVAVIGSGYTGLSAALQLVRGGRDTLVLDAEAIGWGCSTRNGGQISTSIKPGFADLARRHGPERARAIHQTGRDALAWIGRFVAEEGIDCDFRIAGRFHAAHNPAAFRALTSAVANQPKGLEIEAHVVPRAEQHRELVTDAYHGGVVYPRHAAVDPARFHAGLLKRYLTGGGRTAPHAAVTAVRRDGDEFQLETTRGRLRAREVVVATNGYSGKAVPWLRRRIIPIGSYIIATEPLPPGLVERLMPADRIVSDSRRLVYYYRASPDRRRILFGGRVSFAETDPRRSGPLLRAELVRLFPELATARISHSWFGLVAYTFDTLAHAGEADGLHYAAGYCGSGVSMASYLGTRLGQRILGRPEGRTGLDDLPFQTRPLYHGNPWFLAPSVMLYRWRDRLNL